MKVDLQTVKAEIEAELQQLEKRRSELQAQMAHIEAVQQMANERAKPDESGRLEADSEAKVAGAAAGGMQ
jgi:hypothetical protein